MRRLLIVLDVTEVEAKILGDHLAELGPEYRGFGVKEGVDAKLADLPNNMMGVVTIRSGGSVTLGGKDTPSFRDE